MVSHRVCRANVVWLIVWLSPVGGTKRPEVRACPTHSPVPMQKPMTIGQQARWKKWLRVSQDIHRKPPQSGMAIPS